MDMFSKKVASLTFLLTSSFIPAWCASDSTWYPNAATPYPGTSFHCTVTPLPKGLPGIPSTDTLFIDHCFAVVLKCAQEKELMMKAIGDNKAFSGNDRFRAKVQSELTRLQGLSIPTGLENFESDIEQALNLQITFFDKASKQSASGASLDQVLTIPEGKEASQKLFAAWDELQKRYTSWNPATKDSIYHHFQALDLY